MRRLVCDWRQDGKGRHSLDACDGEQTELAGSDRVGAGVFRIGDWTG